MRTKHPKPARNIQWRRNQRQGIVLVLSAFLLTVLFAFVALSVDTGRIVLTETRMQNAVDAASLAASQEITAAVYAAGQGQGSANIDANSIAVEAAREMAGQVAEANGVFIDPAQDVQFGKRVYNPSTGEWPVQWGASPYNVVKVTARRNGDDTSAPDGEFPLAFGWAIGKDSVPLETSSTAFVEARDLVLVLDYSGSMNYDSLLTSSLGSSEAHMLLDGIWDSLVAADPKWPATSKSKFPSTGFGSINSYEGTYVSSSDTATIRNTLGLNANGSDGKRKYPFPQAGRNSDGSPKSQPSNATSDSLWNGYIDYVKGSGYLPSAYRKKYGYRTLMHYLQERPSYSGWRPRSLSEDLWRTPHYPMQALKDGATLFLDFLHDLDFGDEVGLVGYAGEPSSGTGGWVIDTFSDGDISVNITSNPITPDYDTIDLVLQHHQAGERGGQTAMGDGIKKGADLLDNNSRYGARPTIVLMTDGVPNEAPSGWNLPSGFSWAEWTDYDGDGDADYTPTGTTSEKRYKSYAFWEATEAIKKGIIVHTVCVGGLGDRNLMEAIAFAGGGVFADVPGGSTVSEMEEQLLDAFGQIAAKVPPAQLVYED
jgi:hypothetical protein